MGIEFKIQIIMKKQILKLSLGVDVSKETLAVCLCRLTARLAKEFEDPFEVSNNLPGFKKLVKWLLKNASSPEDIFIVMESTGIYHEALVYHLYMEGFPVSVMQSGRVKRYAQSLDQRSKTDALDSRMLAMLGCERELPLWSPPDPILRQLKGLSRERSFLLKEKQMERNRLHALEHSVYKSKRELKRYGQRLKLIEKQLIEIEKEMEILVKNDPQMHQRIKHLESIPGISFKSAATVVGETLGFTGFTNAKQLTSYAGFDVVLKESGAYRGKTRISKKGNKHIRSALYMPVMSAIQWNPTLRKFYERVQPTKVKPMIALVAVERKLLVLMYSLWKNEIDYDPEHEQKKTARTEVLAAQDRSNLTLTSP